MAADRWREIERRDDVEVERGALLGPHTSFRIGGPADLLAIPRTLEGLEAVLRSARLEESPLLVIGAGSDLLIADEGFRGVALKILPGLAPVEIDGERLTADAGRPLPELARRAAQAGLAGLEFAGGIPGSLGGGVAVNAGARGMAMADITASVRGITLEGEWVEIDGRQLGWSYRQAEFPQPLVITAATLTLTPAPPEEISARQAEWLATRRRTQPLGQPSAGCVFRNPVGAAAGQLIDSAGLKGMRVGGAIVSPKHANFIVNQGEATATQVLELIERVQNRVLTLHGVALELEIKVVGCGLGERGPSMADQYADPDKEVGASCEPPSIE